MLASDSDEIERSAVRRICLATPESWPTRTGTHVVVAQNLQLHPLQILYMGCQWKMLPIERNAKGLPEIHHTRIYRMMRRWQADGSIDRIFAGTVHKLHQDQLLDLSVIHGDGP